MMAFNNPWTENEKTQWFSGLTPPKRHGLYELRIKGKADVVWGHYADSRWRLGNGKYAEGLHLPLTSLEWRGLTEEGSLAVMRRKACKPIGALGSSRFTIYG